MDISCQYRVHDIFCRAVACNDKQEDEEEQNPYAEIIDPVDPFSAEHNLSPSSHCHSRESGNPVYYFIIKFFIIE